MPIAEQKITPCLWFDTEAEDAAKFYCSIFENSKIEQVSRYVDAGQEIHGKKAGSVMVVAFQLEGQKFVALNGGPQFKFDEAISFQISCQTQKEVDYFWSKLTAQGGKEGPCGWLKDKFGLSWQVVADSPHRDDARQGREQGRARHQRLSQDEEVRHRGAEARL